MTIGGAASLVDGLAGGDDDVVGEPPLVGVPVGSPELVVAVAEGDVLFDGVGVGVGDCRVVVGLAEWVAPGSVAVPRLVPVASPPTVLAGSEAVVGVAASLADWPGDVPGPVFPRSVAAGVVLLVSRRTMIAMIPHAARPAPANIRARRRGRGSGENAGSPL